MGPIFHQPRCPHGEADGVGCYWCLKNRVMELENRLEDLEQTSKQHGPSEIMIERWRHDSEDLEALNMWLDSQGVPRELDGRQLSEVGRVSQLVARTYLAGSGVVEIHGDVLLKTTERPVNAHIHDAETDGGDA